MEGREFATFFEKIEEFFKKSMTFFSKCDIVVVV
jgi:hypothetical protein